MKVNIGTLESGRVEIIRYAKESVHINITVLNRGRIKIGLRVNIIVNNREALYATIRKRISKATDFANEKQ